MRCLIKKNKRADIAITILVVGVIALCVLSLLSFYIAGEKQKSEIAKQIYLQKVYNLAESVKFSGSADNYKEVKREGDKFVIEKTFSEEKGLIWKSKEDALRVKYSFMP